VTLNKHNPLSLKSWTLLEKKFEALAKKKIVEYFSEDANRTEKFSKQWESFYVDYSKNLLDEETLDLLVSMAEEAGLKEAIAAYFGGAKINETENRAVLHTALRKLNNQPILVDEEDIGPKMKSSKIKCLILLIVLFLAAGKVIVEKASGISLTLVLEGPIWGVLW